MPTDSRFQDNKRAEAFQPRLQCFALIGSGTSAMRLSLFRTSFGFCVQFITLYSRRYTIPTCFPGYALTTKPSTEHARRLLLLFIASCFATASRVWELVIGLSR